MFYRRKEMKTLQMKMMLLAGLGVLALSPAARADEWNQKTIVTFSDPVEVPGQVLPAGTYVFKLANSNANRNIVQVFNQEENHVFGTFLAIPDYRLRPSDKTIIRFAERPAGQPEAIKAWFYPGKNHGHEFVYPKSEALALAKANSTPVPSMPTELTADTIHSDAKLDGPEVVALDKAPLMAEGPRGEEFDLAQVFQIALVPHSEPGAELPETLPATATSLPFAGVIGLLALGTAVLLRSAAASSK
jgi:hypothetical protein